MDLVFFSVAKTTPFEAFKPTEAAPEETACNAYSICINFPEGLFSKEKSEYFKTPRVKKIHENKSSKTQKYDT